MDGKTRDGMSALVVSCRRLAMVVVVEVAVVSWLEKKERQEQRKKRSLAPATGKVSTDPNGSSRCR